MITHAPTGLLTALLGDPPPNIKVGTVFTKGASFGNSFDQGLRIAEPFKMRLMFSDGRLSQELTVTPNSSSREDGWKNVEFTTLHSGAANRDNFNGNDALSEIFTIDTEVSNQLGADKITNFVDGVDKVVFADLGGDILGNGNKVSWKVVTTTVGGQSQTNIIIYAGDTEDASKILAVIENFTGTFDRADFAWLDSSVTADIATALVEPVVTQEAPAITDGSDAGKQELRGDVNANRFIIDAEDDVKTSADVITGFDLMKDSITFAAEGGGAPADSFNTIWFKKDGDDLLITTSSNPIVIESSGLANPIVLAVLKGKGADFNLNSLPDLDLSFLTSRDTATRWFDVKLDKELGGVTEDTRITDGSAEGQDVMWGSGTSPETVYLKIDVGASAKAQADEIGVNGNATRAFRDGADKIILAGDVTKIVAEASGGDTILYKDAKGDNNVLAVMYGFQATDANFDISDFLVQDDQSFTVDVLDVL